MWGSGWRTDTGVSAPKDPRTSRRGKPDRAGEPAAERTETASVRQRVAKRLARAGLCSRREAERWVVDGRITINGVRIVSPAVDVKPKDVIRVDGKLVPEPERPSLWRFHKPRGVVTTRRDPQGRPTVFDRLPADMPRLMTVGRLDLSSEGLLLLTNDGDLARHLEHPDTGWQRRYRVRVHGAVDQGRLAGLSEGLMVDGVRYGPIEAALERQVATNAWVTMGLREGKNREIRRVLEALGLTVTRLIRVSYGPFHLGKLSRGEVSAVGPRILREQLGAFFTTLDPGDADRRRPA